MTEQKTACAHQMGMWEKTSDLSEGQLCPVCQVPRKYGRLDARRTPIADLLSDLQGVFYATLWVTGQCHPWVHLWQQFCGEMELDKSIPEARIAVVNGVLLIQAQHPGRVIGTGGRIVNALKGFLRQYGIRDVRVEPLQK